MVKPYYDDGRGIQIFHGDCREILPTLPKVDAVVTDPPYGLGQKNVKRNRSHPELAAQNDYGDVHWDDKPVDFTTMASVIGAGKSSIVWGGNYYALPVSSCWLLWDKLNGENNFADGEMAWTNLSGAVRIFRFMWNGMLRAGEQHGVKRVHPTQKPVELMRWCLTFIPNAKTILDPFMGSGTTLRAAKDMNRQAIGIELEEKYCEIAARRMEQEVFNFTP